MVPFDDKGLSGHGADDLLNDDKGNATLTTIAPSSPTQPTDDRDGSGHGSDDLPGDGKGGSSQSSSSSSLGVSQHVLSDTANPFIAKPIATKRIVMS